VTVGMTPAFVVVMGRCRAGIVINTPMRKEAGASTTSGRFI
jgi:hypothetical protein